jgi:hypothetical protein
MLDLRMICGLLALSAGLLGSSARGGVILQDDGDADATIRFFDPIGQTFIADQPYLQTIAFAFSDANENEPNDPITMTLYEGAGTGGTVIDTVVKVLPATLPGTLQPPQFIDFDFSGNMLTPGMVYSAAVTTDSSKVAVVYENDTDEYPDGQIFYDTSFSLSDPIDLNFRVVTSDVPEPATVGLLGLGGLVLCRRRRADRPAV